MPRTIETELRDISTKRINDPISFETARPSTFRLDVNVFKLASPPTATTLLLSFVGSKITYGRLFIQLLPGPFLVLFRALEVSVLRHGVFYLFHFVLLLSVVASAIKPERKHRGIEK